MIVFLCMPDEMKFQEMEAVMGTVEKLPVMNKEERNRSRTKEDKIKYKP